MVEKSSIIPRIINDFDQSLHIVSITRPSDGYSNSVYFITCCNNDHVHQELVLKFIERHHSTEVSFYQFISQSMFDDFPIPKIIQFDLSVEYFYLARQLPGVPLSRSFSTMNPEEQVEIYQQLGNLIGQLHAKHTFTQCGYLQGTKFSDWKSMFKSIIENQVKRFHGTIYESLAEDIQKYLINHLTLIDYDVVPRLLHMDLHCGNILVDNGKISGILDAAEAIIGHNEYELMRIEKGHFDENSSTDQKLREIFMNTYQTHVPLDDNYAKRRPFYSLSRELVGMRCLLDYGEQYTQGESIEEEKIKTELRIRNLLTDFGFDE